ncbi:MAG: GGDEF domain-containing protein [Bacteroidales bacterium]|nr:GGDEF domain-containing protein [Bacteroidales bacterium]
MVKKLKKDEILTKAISDEFPDPMMVVDLKHNVLFVNNLIKKSKYWCDTKPIKCHKALYGHNHLCEFDGQVCDSVIALKQNSTIVKPHKRVDENGNNIYFDTKTIPLRDENKNIYAFLKIVQDKTAEKKREKKLEHLASHDILTTLPNRFLMQDRLEQAILRSNRNKINFVFMFIDLDNFKVINDTLGHNIGDEVLKIAASRMKSSVRKIDTVARLGGDEFIIILESVLDKKRAISIAQDILDNLKKDFEPMQDIKINISCSIGMDIYEPEKLKKTAKQLIQNADIAMYEAKESGKNTYKFFVD